MRRDAERRSWQHGLLFFCVENLRYDPGLSLRSPYPHLPVTLRGIGYVPPSLVAQAIAMNLDVIAVCDHNSSENIAYVQKAAKGQTITVLPGMEITSSEEVHLLALFDSLELLTDLQDVIYTHLAGVNDEDLFGCQAIVNERDEVEGFNDHLLIGATDLPLKSLIDAIHERNGLAIASHIDRESFSVISRLGFIAEDMNFDALEISARMGMEEARRRFP